MSDLSHYLISKWWRRGIAALVTTSPPALLLWFEDRLATLLSEHSPQIIVRIFAILLLTILAMFTLLLLERPWLKWDEPTGTWVNRFDGLRYCGTCRAKKLFVPLKNEAAGWCCVSCKTYRLDPARRSENSAPVRTLVTSTRMKY
jgi:hypothetical protein